MLLGQQESTGCQTVTARRKFTKEDNFQIRKAYYQSDPKERDYRKRMHGLYKSWTGNKIMSEQRMADQVLTIIKRWFTDEEICKLKTNNLQIVSENNDQKETIYKTVDEKIPTKECVTITQAKPDKMVLQKVLKKRNTLSCNVKRAKLPHLKHIQWHKLKQETTKVNSVLGFIPIHNLEDLNNIIIVGASTVTEIFIKEKKAKL